MLLLVLMLSLILRHAGFKREICNLESELNALKIAHNYLQISEATLQRDFLVKDGVSIRDIEIARADAYQKGRADALKEYELVVTPFIETTDSWWKKSAESGYAYQLFVRGLPVLNTARVVLQRTEKVNEESRKFLEQSIEALLSNLPASAAQNIGKNAASIPVKIAETVIGRKKSA